MSNDWYFAASVPLIVSGFAGNVKKRLPPTSESRIIISCAMCYASLTVGIFSNTRSSLSAISPPSSSAMDFIFFLIIAMMSASD